MSRNRVTPKGNFLSFLYDHISGRLSDSSFRQYCGERIWCFKLEMFRTIPREMQKGSRCFSKNSPAPRRQSTAQQRSLVPMAGSREKKAHQDIKGL